MWLFNRPLDIFGLMDARFMLVALLQNGGY